MSSYIAFLGHQPLISLAELSAVIPDFTLQDMPEKHLALFETNEKLDQEFLDTLGGTMVIARQIDAGATLSLEDVPQLLANEIGPGRRKVTFSLRTFGLPKGTVRALYRKCKDRLRKAGRSSRYVGNEKKSALPILLHNNEMIEGKRGCELTIVLIGEEEEKTLWIGRTVAAHDVDFYSFRDMEKPVRDTTVGLLPPKLAQILLNFGVYLVRELEPESKSPPKRKKKEIYTVFDPFCGTGVIPMEGLLRDWPVLASDKSLKAVNGCSKNIEWLRKEEKILKKYVPSKVWKQDALKPFELKEDVDMIVTETTLGPPLEKRPTQKDVARIRRESEELQAAFLENVAESLPGVPVVCIWPAWKQKGGWIKLEKIWKVIKELGFEPVLPPGISTNREVPSLFYSRADQFVGREIVLLLPPEEEEK